MEELMFHYPKYKSTHYRLYIEIDRISNITSDIPLNLSESLQFRSCNSFLDTSFFYDYHTIDQTNN